MSGHCVSGMSYLILSYPIISYDNNDHDDDHDGDNDAHDDEDDQMLMTTYHIISYLLQKFSQLSRVKSVFDFHLLT